MKVIIESVDGQREELVDVYPQVEPPGGVPDGVGELLLCDSECGVVGEPIPLDRIKRITWEAD